MGDYLKLFEEHTDYETYIGGQDVILPNVSYCEDNKCVHYNPIVTIQPLIATYNVENVSNPTQLYMYMNQQDMTILGAGMFSKVEIDGTDVSIADLDTAQGQYQLSNGEHTVKYTLIDPTFIGVGLDGETGTKLGAVFAQMCPNIISVEIPNSVTSIGNSALYGCSGLTSVTIPNSVTSIGDGAFGNCSGLTSVTIGSGVTSISSDAFSYCTSLTSVTIPNSVASIGDYAFSNCRGLTSVTIGNGVTSIGDYAFNNCTSLTSVTIEATTPPTLGDFVFNYNASGRKIYVPAASVEAYKAASGWSTYAADIEAIPTT